MTALVVIAATIGHHRRHGLIGLVLLVIVIAGVGYYVWRRRQARQERDVLR
jgi:hypothetical protein